MPKRKLHSLNLTGIKEVQIIQWFVQPGARVEQFDKICEVQSDKAATDVRSRTPPFAVLPADYA